MDSDKIQGILDRSQALLDEGKIYEYEQKIKTLACRYSAQKKYTDEYQLLKKGAIQILQKNEITAGIDLACLSIESLKKIHPETPEQMSDDIRKDVLELFNSGKFDKYKIQLINKSLNSLSKTGDTQICNDVGQTLLINKEYALAQKFILHSQNIPNSIKLLREWIPLGEPQEKELFVCRFVLLKLGVKQISQAKAVFNFFKSQLESSPLVNFTGFMIRAIEARSIRAFSILVNKYQKSYQRDKGFGEIISRIGVANLGLQKQKEFSLLNFLFN